MAELGLLHISQVGRAFQGRLGWSKQESAGRYLSRCEKREVGE